MKLRVTGLLLCILIFALAVVPAFAAAVDQNDEAVETGGEVSEIPAQSEEAETEETVEAAVSVSPFYLEDTQLTDLVYQNIAGINYVTVESFVTAMNPESMVEEADGRVVVTAATVSEIVDTETENTEAALANVEEEILNLCAEIGSCYAVANGRYLYVADGVQLVEGKVALPVRIMAEIFNLSVSYDGESRSILLSHQIGSGCYIMDGESYYDEDVLYWLSRIIYAESGNQSMAGKIAVGNVVMNRVSSSGFPNTIKEVLFQKNQFSPAMNGSIYRTPKESSVIAAKLVMDGAVVVEHALFFNRAGMNTFAARNRTYVATIGAHAFYN